MIYTRPFIGVDWGTSRMRAMLVGDEALDKSQVVFGEGIGRLSRPIADELFEAIGPWVDRLGKLDVVMAGMVGSNIGWRTVPYLDCPAPLTALGDFAARFTHQGHTISILPGVRCQSAMGVPDVMRGEELQLFGWLKSNPTLPQAERLFCLPGTHTKWARLVDGKLESFNTALTGELFALLQQHSILIPKESRADKPPFDLASFSQGLEFVRSHPGALLHALFSTRSRLLTDAQAFADASSYLSGLLIGSDIQTALDIYRQPGAVVELIGDESLCQKYGHALEAMGNQYAISDGMDAIHAGFRALPSGEKTC